jgi:kinesin family protein 20
MGVSRGSYHEQEAHRVLHQGQSNRRVFSTLANRASSRSHSIFSIKIVRTSRTSSHEVTSKFSVVDLAGSERVVNTQTTGERLKEAGNINKSLMVLGQCMEVLRKNQERGEGKKVRLAR